MGLFSNFFGGGQETKTEIPTALKQPSKDLISGLMAAGSVNPWSTEYTGPRMAAVNPAQMQGMDGAAMRGNALGFNFTPASQSLPQSTTIGGMDAYDTLGLANQGISPELQELYSYIFGPSGPLSAYALGGAPADNTPDTGVGGPWTPNTPLDAYNSYR